MLVYNDWKLRSLEMEEEMRWDKENLKSLGLTNLLTDFPTAFCFQSLGLKFFAFCPLSKNWGGESIPVGYAYVPLKKEDDA